MRITQEHNRHINNIVAFFLLGMLLVITICSIRIAHSMDIIASPATEIYNVPQDTTGWNLNDAKILDIGDIQIHFRDYQLEVVEDSILVYDLNRLVGVIPMNASSYDAEPLSTMILDDNQ